MNLFELQERLKDFSQDQLVREMQAPTGTAPQYLVLSELQRRQRMMAEEQAQMQTPQTTVAEDAIAAAGVPQGGLADMARAMAPQTDMDMNTAVQPVERMRDGGVVRMQPGGLAGLSRNVLDYGIDEFSGLPPSMIDPMALPVTEEELLEDIATNTRRGRPDPAPYDESDLAGVSPGRGRTEPVTDAPSLVDLFAAEGEGSPRAARSTAIAEEAAAAAEAEQALRAAESARMLEINEIPGVTRRVTDDGEVIAPAIQPPTVSSSDSTSATGVAAPAMDDAFDQDKWLALAQAGLSLMSSQQPTIGGAIGEAGLSGITALRQARGERDERIERQQARDDRLAAAARADREDAYPYRQVDDIVEMAKLFRQSAADIKAANFDQVPAADTPEGIEYRRNLIRANELTRRALAMGGVE